MTEVVTRTRRAVGLALGARDSLAVVVTAAVLYFALYLVAIGHVTVSLGRGGVSFAVASDPVALLFETMGPLLYEPVARVVLGPVSWLIAPGNVLIGVALATLVGLNLGVWFVLWRRPQACGVDGSKTNAGLIAGVPALLSGSACCGPVVFLVLGVQATGAVITAVAWLVPAAAVLLVVTLVLVARNVSLA